MPSPANSLEETRLGRWRRRLQAILRPARDFLFPPACLGCQAIVDSSRDLCVPCQSALAPLQPQCLRCGAPVGPHLETAQGCVHCRDERFAFRRALVLGPYDAELRQVVRQGKSRHGSPLIEALTDLFLERHLADLLTDPFDAIVPVPQYWKTRFWNIHSAAETFGSRLSVRLGRPFRPRFLVKVRETPKQALATPSVRRTQQRGAFAVPPPLRLEGARLLLVDDVLTTGATANEAAKALIAGGCADVLVAALARGIGQRGVPSA